MLSQLQEREHAELAKAYARFKVAGTPEEAVLARKAVFTAREMLNSAQQAVQSSESRSSTEQRAQHQMPDAASTEVSNH